MRQGLLGRGRRSGFTTSDGHAGCQNGKCNNEKDSFLLRAVQALLQLV